VKDNDKAIEEASKYASKYVTGLDEGSAQNNQAFLALLRLVEVSARAAEKHEELRQNLILGSWDSVPELLQATFKVIKHHSGKGASGFAWEDLRDVMAMHGIHTTDHELNCLWHRYAGGTKVATVETPYNRFCDMLRPFDLEEHRLATTTIQPEEPASPISPVSPGAQYLRGRRTSNRSHTIYKMPSCI
jgi:hypothetical protein